MQANWTINKGIEILPSDLYGSDSGSCTDSYILMDILKLLLSMHTHREKGKCDASN